MERPTAPVPPPGCPAHQPGGRVPIHGPEFAADPQAYYSYLRHYGPTAPVELVRYPPGGPARVLRRFPPGILVLASDVIQHPDGTRDIYVTTIRCHAPERREGDIYKIVDAGQP